MPTYYSMIRCHRIMCNICGAHFFEHERSDICNSMPAAGYMYNTESALKLLVRVPAAVCCLLVPSSRCYVPLPVGDTRAVTDEYTWGPHLSLHSATGSEGKGRGGAIGPGSSCRAHSLAVARHTRHTGTPGATPSPAGPCGIPHPPGGYSSWAGSPPAP